MKKKTWLNAVFVVSFSFLAWFGTTPAKADTIELALVLDGSGSLGQTGWDSQVLAYKTIFNDSFVDNYITAGDELYVSAFVFSAGVNMEIGQTLIDTNTAAGNFGDLIGGLTWPQGWTHTDLAITAAADYLTGVNTVDGDRMIMDISTDGLPYWSGEPDEIGVTLAAATAAHGAGVTINAIGVGPNISVSFLNDLTVAGGGDYWMASGFDEFEASLSDKLYTEITASVPEPATVALLGIGIVGLAGAEVRRRRKKKAVDIS